MKEGNGTIRTNVQGQSGGAVLADPASHTAMRAAARATIVEKYDLATVCLPAQVALLRDLAQDDGAPPQ